MKSTTTLIFIAFSTAVSGLAAAPVASVSSASSFALDGNSMTLSGVASWPMVVGDQVTSGASSAYFLFKDGSQLTLAPQSSLRISGEESRPVVVLQSGAVDYKIAKGSKLSLVKELETPVTANASAPVTSGFVPAVNASHAALLTTAVSAGSGGVGTLLAATRLTGSASASTTAATSSDMTARKISISIYK